MRAPRKIIAFLAVLLIWTAYSRFIMLFWGYYPSINPILEWALSALIPDYRVLFYALIYTHDILINILIVLPVGYLLRKYSRQDLWGPVVASVTLVFLWDYRQVFSAEGSGISFFSSFGAILGVLIALGALPLVYYLVSKLNGKYAI